MVLIDLDQLRFVLTESSAIVEMVQEEGVYGTGNANSLNGKRREADCKCEIDHRIALIYKSCGLTG